MATITTRAGKGSPLTNSEVDSNFTNINTELGQKESASNKGVANGYASLDGSGKVPSTQLPSYVDDVVEGANLAALPGTGETGKIYVTLDTNKTYRWSGSAYVEISASPGSTDAVPEGSTNLYFSNTRARSAVSAAGSLSYNSSTGVFSYTQPTNVSTFTNDSGYLTGITSAQVTTALGYTPANRAGETFTGNVSLNGYTMLRASDGLIYPITDGTSGLGGAGNRFNHVYASAIYYGSSNTNLATALAAKADASSLASYLPLSGGTLTGELYAPNLTVGGLGRSSLNAIGGNIGSTAGSWNNSQLELKNTDGGTVALSFHRAGVSSHTIEVRDGSGLRINGDFILHAGNYSGYSSFSGRVSGTEMIAPKFGILDGPIDCYMEVTDQNPTIDGVGYGGEFKFYGDQSIASSHIYAGGASFNNAPLVNGNRVLHAGNYTSYAMSLTGMASGRDDYVNLRVIRNQNAAPNDGMYIGYGNGNSGRTRIYSDGSTSSHFYSDSNGSIFRSDGATYLHSSNYTSYTNPSGNLHYVNSEYNATITSNGWHTIAEYGSGRAQATFHIFDQDSSRHNYVRVNVVWSYGNGGAYVVSAGRHGSSTIRHVRLLYNTSDQTYGGVKVQVYCENADWGNWVLRVRQETLGISGWGAFTQVTPTLANSVSSFAEYSRASNVNDNGWLSVPSGLYIGGNTTLHAGNYSSYALPLSGGTMSGVITFSGSGTAINLAGQSDNIGYNATTNLGTYIKGTSSTWLYGGGEFYDGTASRQLLHSGNYANYAIARSGGTLVGHLALSDNRLYLRTNGDTNHYLWNSDDDWEEMVAWSGTGFRVKSSNGSTLSTFTTSGVYLNALRTDRAEASNGTFVWRVGANSGTTRHINLSDSETDPASASINSGITWGARTDNQPYYMIYAKSAYNNGYSTHTRLTLAWHTGIEIGAEPGYGGVRFFNNSPFAGSEIFSVGKGDGHVRVNNNLYVGGNLALHAGNYNSYAPTLTGGGASGTWNITAANSNAVSGRTAHQLFNNMGQNHSTYQDFNNVPDFGTYYVQQGGNSPTGTASHQWYGFTLGLGNDYALSSYGTQFYWPRRAQNSDTYIYVRDREGGSWTSWTKIKAGYADTAGSVAGALTNGSGGVTIGNGSASEVDVAYSSSGGTWEVGTNNNYGTNSFFWYRGGTGYRAGLDANANMFVEGSSRAPIFYDSNNTGYYVDPASGSNLAGTVTVNGGKLLVLSDSGGYGQVQINSSNTSTEATLLFGSGGSGQNSGGYTYAGVIGLGAYGLSKSNLYFGCSYSGPAFFIPWTGDYAQANGSFRAPIFYDSNDTSYNLDPSSTSRLYYAIPNKIKCVNHVNYEPRWDFTAYVVEAQHWYGNNSSMTMYIGEGNPVQIPGTPRAPIFYDYNDTGYYTDTNSTSRMADIHANRIGVNQGVNASWPLIVNGNAYLNGGGYGQAEGSWRAPLFYDSENTAYYLNPNGTSRVATLDTDRVTYLSKGYDAVYLGGSGLYQIGYPDTNWWKITTSSTFSLLLSCGWDWDRQVGFHYTPAASGSNGGVLRIGQTSKNSSSYNHTYTYMHMNGADRFYWDWNGVFQAYGDSRAPVFYEYGNTGYYLNLDSTTALRTVGSWRADSASWDGEFSGKIQYHSSNWYFQYAGSALFRNSGGSNVFTIDQSGNAVASGNVTAYSDRRLKSNVITLNSASKYLSLIDAKRFTWNTDGRADIGFIAQDVEEAGLPEFVLETGGYDPNTETHSEAVKSLDYGRMVAVLWQAVKEQQSQIEAAVAEIKSLKERLQ